MKYTNSQLKIINSRKSGFSIIKGTSNTGKTAAALGRIRKLLRSFCIEKDDNIIMIIKDEEKLKDTKDLYNKMHYEQFYQESFFKRNSKECLKLQTIDNLAFSLFNSFKKSSKKNSKISLISKSTKIEIITEIINTLIRNENVIRNYEVDISKYNIKLSKQFINKFNVDFLINEIKYIKSFQYSLEEYYESNRRNCNNVKLRKNSKARKNIYDIMTIYNFIMKKMFWIDGEDLFLIALKEAENLEKHYTHVFIDDCQEYTKVQLLLIEKLIKFKSYSNVVYIMNNKNMENQYSYIKFKRNLNEFNHEFKGKTTILKKIINEGLYSSNGETKFSFKELPKKTYIDLKHNRTHTFINDDKDNIYITDMNIEEKACNICEIPVFNEIAAGKPILMNEHLEDTYFIPEEWIRGVKNAFILKIQGDSMIEKNIEDGDFVIIDSTKYVNNNDIVAVEFAGEATLKTFKREEKKILFKPANSKYAPIEVYEGDEFSILGVAVGIIKKDSNEQENLW